MYSVKHECLVDDIFTGAIDCFCFLVLIFHEQFVCRKLATGLDLYCEELNVSVFIQLTACYCHCRCPGYIHRYYIELQFDE